MHRLTTLVDFFFPPSESGLLLRHTNSDTFLSFYVPQHHQTVTTLAAYQEPLIKAAITAGKFEHNLEGLELLAQLLTHHLTAWPHDPNRTAIVPIPLHPKRQRERGYNQVTEIIKYSNALLPVPFPLIPALIRTRATPPQSHLGRMARQKNLVDAFALAPRLPTVEGMTHIIVLDDVVTTGTTLATAATVLNAHTADHIAIHQLAIARAY